MPLRAGKSDKVRNQNIRTLMGEVGKSPHVQSRAQAIAISYAKQRAAKGKADGGPTDGPPPTDAPSDPAVAPIPYIDFPDQSAPPTPPPPTPRQAMPKPQRPPTGPPTAASPKGHGSPRNPADLVRNLKTFYDHYGELRPDQQKRLMEMLGQPLDQPSGMRPEIDWDEFMKSHDLPGAMRERPMYHPPYRGAAGGGRIGQAMRLARQDGGDTPDGFSNVTSPATPVESDAMTRTPDPFDPSPSDSGLGPQPERGGIPLEEENIRPLYKPGDQREEWGWGPRPHPQHPQQLLQPPTPPSHVFPEPSPFVKPYHRGPGRQRYLDTARGGAIDHAMRIARKDGGTDGADGSSGQYMPDAPSMSQELPDYSGPALGPHGLMQASPPPPWFPPQVGAPEASGKPSEQRQEKGVPSESDQVQGLRLRPGQRPGREIATGGAIGHAMRIARQAGGANPIALPLMGKPGDAAAPAFQGPIHSHVPGRTDKIDLDVAPGSYVVPADVVSSFGEGNSLAGGHLIRFQMGAGANLAGGIKAPQAGHGMLPMQPHPKLAHMKPPKGQKHAVGGVTHNNGNVPIVATGGEVVIPPEHLVHKFGDLDRGHKVWDEIVRQEREAEIKRLKSAPSPKK